MNSPPPSCFGRRRSGDGAVTAAAVAVSNGVTVMMIGSLLVAFDSTTPADGDPPAATTTWDERSCHRGLDDTEEEKEQDHGCDLSSPTPVDGSSSSSTPPPSPKLIVRMVLAMMAPRPHRTTTRLALEDDRVPIGSMAAGHERGLNSHVDVDAGEGVATILACSSTSPWDASGSGAGVRRQMSAEHAALIMGNGDSDTGGTNYTSGRRGTAAAAGVGNRHYRRLGEDRKGFFDHLRPRPLIKSTIRVTVMQGTQVATQYLNDQLKEDLDRDELVAKGKMSRHDADDESAMWSEREWKRRWEAFPHRLLVALGKYHAILLAMRLYEDAASRMVSDVTLDRLTMDTFEAARRLSTDEGKSGRSMASSMFTTCWRANLISYVADYSVHQVILLFGYYVYVRDQHRLRQHKHLPNHPDEDEDERALQAGTLLLSVIKNSTLLALSRALGLLFSSLGGAVGSLVAPAWGSLAGAQLGDALALAASDEFIGPGAPLL